MPGPYQERFSKGTPVRVASRQLLENFRAAWRYHTPLESAQLEFAGMNTTVKSVGYYHGGDVLYSLEGIPGLWHEACVQSQAVAPDSPGDVSWVCTCACHVAGHVVVHPVPCCESCPNCKVRVARGFLTAHNTTCSSRAAENK